MNVIHLSVSPLLGCRLLSGRGFALDLGSLSGLGLCRRLLPSGLSGGGLNLGGGLLLVLNRLGLKKEAGHFNKKLKVFISKKQTFPYLSRI